MISAVNRQQRLNGNKTPMKKIPALFFCILFLFAGINDLFSQTPDSSSHPSDSAGYHIAVFLPLFLDSAFDAAGNYRFDQNFPKYLNPGLEFYEGLELAADSLRKTGAPFDITVYDTRSSSRSLQQILEDPAFAKMQLIIGHVTVAELRLLANAARNMDIPFINVNFPNDGGVTN